MSHLWFNVLSGKAPFLVRITKEIKKFTCIMYMWLVFLDRFNGTTSFPSALFGSLMKLCNLLR
jgi:hypothetical protein